MSIQRDPHLPPPEVCDWLLAQEWSGVVPLAVTTYPEGGPGITEHAAYDHVYARAALGANEVVAVEMPVEALQLLEEDAWIRREEAELVLPGDDTTRESDPAASLAAAVAELEAKEAERLKRVTLEEFEAASTSFKLKRQELMPDELARKANREASRVDESLSHAQLNNIVSTERTDPETALLRRVLADAEQAEISAFSAIGVLTTAATMMVSQCYDLTKLGDDHADA